MANTDKRLLLSRLCFEIVKDSIVMPNNSDFSDSDAYDAFLQKKDYFGTNSDWSLQYKKAFDGLNLAISRLKDFEKLPYFTTSVKVYRNTNYTFEFTPDADEVEEIMNVFRPLPYGAWKNYEFRQHGEKVDIIGGDIPLNHKEEVDGKEVYYAELEIEYKKVIPNFTEDDISVATISDGNDGVVRVDSNIDLRDYGFNRQMYQYVKLYAESQIVKEIDPVTGGNMFVTAEGYLNDISTKSTSYNQHNIARVF